MTTSNYEFITTPGRKPIKAWNKGVEFDQNTYDQLGNIASLPFVFEQTGDLDL